MFPHLHEPASSAVTATEVLMVEALLHCKPDSLSDAEAHGGDSGKGLWLIGAHGDLAVECE